MALIGLEIAAQLVVCFKYSFEVMRQGQTKPFADQRRPALYQGGEKRRAVKRRISVRLPAVQVLRDLAF
jgi:hypothetical protein